MPTQNRVIAFLLLGILAALVGCVPPESSESESNKEVIRRFIAETDAQNWAAYDDLVSPDLVFHLPGGNSWDREQMEENEQMFAVGFPDASRSMDQIIAEGDRVVLRETFRGTHNGEFMEIPATGRRVEFTANIIYRIDNGKIAEAWGEVDFGVLMSQLDADPETGAAGSGSGLQKSGLISEAKDVVSSHEGLAMAGELDGVMSNMADDIVVLTYGVPLIEGKSAFREFYAGIMAAGSQKFGHDYTGEEAIEADVVVLHGVSRGSFTSSDGAVSEFSNNFIHILRRGDDGSFKFWRVSVAPDAPAPLTGE